MDAKPPVERSAPVVDGVYRLVKKLGEDASAQVFLAAVDPERFDYATLYAYAKAQAPARADRLRQAEATLAHLRAQNPTPAALRKALPAKGVALPGDTATLKVGKAGADPGRFAEEWADLAGLEHGNVVRVLGGGVHGGRPYYAMEALAGIVPCARVAGEFAPADRIEVALQAGAGLLRLHGRGVVHGRLHPGCLVTVGEAGGAHRTVVTRLDLGDPADPPRFLPPESMSGAPAADPRADVYGLGAVLQALLAGRRPYHDCADAEAIRQCAARGGRPFPPELPEGLPEHLAGILAAATAPRPEDRPSLAEFLEDLRAARDGEDPGRAWHYRACQERVAPADPPAAKRVTRRIPSIPAASKAVSRKVATPKRGVSAALKPAARAPAGKRPGRPGPLVIAGAVAAVLAVAAVFWSSGGTKKEAVAPAATAETAGSAPARPIPRPATKTALAKQLLDLTGAPRVKVAWTRGSRDEGGTLMVFDTEEGTERVLVPGRKAIDPKLSPDATRVLFTSTGQTSYIVNWDGSGLRQLFKGRHYYVMGCVRDAKTGVEWAYVGDSQSSEAQKEIKAKGIQASDDSSLSLWRHRLDDLSVKELAWDKMPYNRRLSVAADGSCAFGEVPWPNCGVFTLPNGAFRMFGQGCNGNLAPDGSGRFFHLIGDHRQIKMYDKGGAQVAQFPVNTMPGIKDPERKVWRPRWSTDVRFFAVQSSDLGKDADIAVGRFDERFSSVKAWVRLTDTPEYDADALVWVGRE